MMVDVVERQEDNEEAYGCGGQSSPTLQKYSFSRWIKLRRVHRSVGDYTQARLKIGSEIRLSLTRKKRDRIVRIRSLSLDSTSIYALTKSAN